MKTKWIDSFRVSNCKSNVLFLLSGICCCLLIYKANTFGTLLSLGGAVFILFLSFVIRDVRTMFVRGSAVLRVCAGGIAVGAALLFAARSELLSLVPGQVGKLLVAALAIASLYSLVLMAVLAFSELGQLAKQAGCDFSPREMWGRLWSNRLWLVSSYAFILLTIRFTKTELIAAAIAFAAIALIFSQPIQLKTWAAKAGMPVRIVSAVSAFGICSFNVVFYFSKIHLLSEKLPSFLIRLLAKTGIDVNILFIAAVVTLALLSFAVIHVLVIYVLQFVLERLLPLLRSLSTAERILYGAVLLLLEAFVIVSFCGSEAFWGTSYDYDVIFTSDSPFLIRENAFLYVSNPENDIRQPLFALFAAPFVGVGYALSLPFSFAGSVVTPLLMNLVQIVLLLAGNLMLADMTCHSRRSRICFMLISSWTYATLLFSLMVEQYIVVYFWLMLAIYCFEKKNRMPALTVAAMGGTLMTGMVFLPLSHDYTGERGGELRRIASDMEKAVMTFVMLAAAFSQSDVFLNFSRSLKHLSGFTGGYGWKERLHQYSSFVSSVFIAPETKVYYHERYSIALSDASFSQLNVVGLLLIAFCVLGFFLVKKDKLTVLAGIWIAFSAFMLLMLGWGSKENGMVLYILYFGWAFLVLLFRLVEWAAEKIGFDWLVPVASGAVILLLAWVNAHGLYELLHFAFQYYPL